MTKTWDSYETIKWINIASILIVVFLFVFFLLKKLWNRSFYYKNNTPIINSQDNNISNGKIDEISQSWLNHLGSDLRFEYANTTKYVKICNHLDVKQRVVKTPKWYMPSIGYELEYILASIWFAHWLDQKNKTIVTAKKIMFWRPLIINIIFVVCLAVALFLYLISLNTFKSFEIERIRLNLHIFSISFCLMSLLSHILLVLNYKMSITAKNELEVAFSAQLADFISNNYLEYHDDLAIARSFSCSVFNSFDLTSFLVNKKTDNLKYFGPFVIL